MTDYKKGDKVKFLVGDYYVNKCGWLYIDITSDAYPDESFVVFKWLVARVS